MASRRRNAVLQSLESFRNLHPRINLTQILAFLYIAENEGLSVTELSVAFRTTVATASRTARALYPSGHPEALEPSVGLIEPRRHASIAHGRLLYLTPKGVELREALERVIAGAAPILPKVA